jgi:hypothetical protein
MSEVPPVAVQGKTHEPRPGIRGGYVGIDQSLSSTFESFTQVAMWSNVTPKRFKAGPRALGRTYEPTGHFRDMVAMLVSIRVHNKRTFLSPVPPDPNHKPKTLNPLVSAARPGDDHIQDNSLTASVLRTAHRLP